MIERAKGILQHKHNLTEEEAYLRLRNESRRLRRSMRDLAEAVILADDLNRKEGVTPAKGHRAGRLRHYVTGRLAEEPAADKPSTR